VNTPNNRNPKITLQPNEGRPREFVQGLERGLNVIRALAGEYSGLNIAKVAHKTQMTRAGARRYLFTLRSLGYVRQIGDRFVVTAKLLDLGFAYLSAIDLPNIVPPFLLKVTRALQESCSVGILDGDEIIYVARRAAEQIMSVNLALGSRLPAHATSLGKVLLGSLSAEELDNYFATCSLDALTPQTITDEAVLRVQITAAREHGWACSDQESEEGLRSIAAPLVDRDGNILAAMNVSAHAPQVTMEKVQAEYLPVLLAGAKEASAALAAGIPKA
jgi:IclR family transcriptional regulator, pca regulon regulatory protein